jgi:D-3-phosphoglycerate dehydrogenase
MHKIQTLNNISRSGTDRLPTDRYQIANDIAEPDAILLRSADMHKLDVPVSVKAVARAGAGTNNIPVAAFSARGVPVFNAPGANANAVKELVLAGMLLSARNVGDALGFVSGLAGHADPHHAIEHEKKRFVGIELAGRTLGVAVTIEVPHARRREDE